MNIIDHLIANHIAASDKFVELAQLPLLADKHEFFKREALWHLEQAGTLRQRQLLFDWESDLIMQEKLLN